MDTTEERKQVHEELQSQVLSTFDMDNMPKPTHNWVDRGVVLSCEGANHPNHRHYKRQIRK